jgi:hypothetical protein
VFRFGAEFNVRVVEFVGFDVGMRNRTPEPGTRNTETNMNTN